MPTLPDWFSFLGAGKNSEAARLSGIDVALTKTLVLAIIGTLAALSGILLASQVSSGIGTLATGMELHVISATIIGGTSLHGGEGRVWGVFLGVLFLGSIGAALRNKNLERRR